MPHAVTKTVQEISDCLHLVAKLSIFLGDFSFQSFYLKLEISLLLNLFIYSLNLHHPYHVFINIFAIAERLLKGKVKVFRTNEKMYFVLKTSNLLFIEVSQVILKLQVGECKRKKVIAILNQTITLVFLYNFPTTFLVASWTRISDPRSSGSWVINWLLWPTIWVILDHWSLSGPFQRNAPVVFACIKYTCGNLNRRPSDQLNMITFVSCFASHISKPGYPL